MSGRASRPAWRAGLCALVAGVLLAGCSPSLPDPESPGAQVLQRRCQGCHAPPAPASMTLAMWQMQLERMHGLFTQLGRPWLDAGEEAALGDYLRAHAGTQ